jgi:hypothetical protein
MFSRLRFALSEGRIAAREAWREWEEWEDWAPDDPTLGGLLSNELVIDMTDIARISGIDVVREHCGKPGKIVNGKRVIELREFYEEHGEWEDPRNLKLRGVHWVVERV